jgi:stearoyl-CoA desaturase (delta-9 desaturase)
MGWVVFATTWLLAATVFGLGNTVGYHRLLAHRAFKAPTGVVWLFALLGAAHSGSPAVWVGLHRLHHTKSDGVGDPHTPVFNGFWFAHSGWLIGTANPVLAVVFALSGFGQQAVLFVHDVRRVLGRNPPEWRTMCPDLMKQPLFRLLDAPFVMSALFAAQIVIAWLIAGPVGVGWLWLLHLALTNASWAVNSVGHTPAFGRQAYDNGDQSRDVPWLAVVTNGEGYHNSHHRYPRSARHALDGGPDLSWVVITLLCRVGLASDPWLPRKYR